MIVIYGVACGGLLINKKVTIKGGDCIFDWALDVRQ